MVGRFWHKRVRVARFSGVKHPEKSAKSAGLDNLRDFSEKVFLQIKQKV